MKLVIYNKKNSMSGTRTGERTIGFNRKTGMIYLSRMLADEMKLEEDDKIILANDEDQKAWYICKTKEDEGFNIKNDKGGIRFTNKYLVKKVLNSLKTESNATFLVAKDITEADGLMLYRIITSGPINKGVASKTKKTTSK